MTHRPAGLTLAVLLASGALMAAPPAKTAKKANTPAKPAKTAEAPKDTTLTFGSKAPELKVARWIKGTPVSLKQGELYVVEFWATWCGPCRATIPHLTELAKKHAGKVSFVGVNVWERGKGPELEQKVDAFVKDMGAKMDYHVARDTEDGFMAKAWMQAAKQNGIPAAFVVGRKGEILWIGNPGGEELGKVLDQVVAGTYDLKAAKAAFDKEMAEEAAEQTKQEEIQKAVQAVKGDIEAARTAKDYAKMASTIEAALVKYPILKDTMLPAMRVAAQAHTTPATALAALKAAGEDTVGLAATLAQEEGLDATVYQATIEPLTAVAAKNKRMLSILAGACFRAGKKAEAVQHQTDFIAWAKTAGAPEAYLQQAEKTLASYK